MSKKLKTLERKLSLYKISGKASMSTCGMEAITQTFHIISTSERNAITTLDQKFWGSDEIYIDEIVNLSNKKGYIHDFLISDNAFKVIKSEVDLQVYNLDIVKKEIINL